MKTKKVKLQLRKIEISNLTNLKGGAFGDSLVLTISKNFVDLCCDTQKDCTGGDPWGSGVTCGDTSIGVACTENGCQSPTN
ncbi:hypothetical protein [Kordia zhangzhouensis]|uniref:hypothetical protein n=1 Tax=Kordia zhangzhouensis TaxID=1620405 RepID=UPI0006296512|nr:hypothetical protein [Kordia zhangzhouensis]